MKILEVCFSPALGGLELYCLNAAQKLRERGHQVWLWLAEGSRMLNHPLARELSPMIFSAPGYFSPRFSRKAKGFVGENGIQLIHLHRSRDLSAFAPLKGVARVLTLQIESSLSKRDLFHRYVYTRLDMLITLTERMRGLAIRALPVNPERLRTLPYGIDADFLLAHRGDREATRQRFNIPADALLIGLVGRLEESKGQELLLRAFSRIHQRYPEAHLLFAGEPPPEKSGFDVYLIKLARELGLEDRVHFVGFQVDTAPVFAALDVFVLASREEAFGLVLLEAMAQGLPIIATRAGGVPEILQDDSSGLLVPPGDEPALAKALTRVMEDPELRQRLGQNGYRIVRDKFSLTRHLEQLEACFGEALAHYSK